MILRSVNDGNRAASILLGRFRWNKGLVGTKDGINKVFVTPDLIFVQSGEIVIRIFYNGQRFSIGSSCDYVVSESGGVGTGYDTVTLSVAPQSFDALTADYFVP